MCALHLPISSRTFDGSHPTIDGPTGRFAGTNEKTVRPLRTVPLYPFYHLKLPPVYHLFAKLTCTFLEKVQVLGNVI